MKPRPQLPVTSPRMGTTSYIPIRCSAAVLPYVKQPDFRPSRMIICSSETGPSNTFRSEMLFRRFLRDRSRNCSGQYLIRPSLPARWDHQISIPLPYTPRSRIKFEFPTTNCCCLIPYLSKISLKQERAVVSGFVFNPIEELVIDPLSCLASRSPCG